MIVRPRQRRRKRSLLARVRTYWVVFAVTGLLVALAVWRLATLPAFQLHDLTVTGLAHVPKSEVVARAAIDPSVNIWLLDRGAIERRIVAIPYVFTAHIHRRPLGNVWIEIEERRAEACARDSAGTEITVDRDLRVLESGCARGTSRTYDVRGIRNATPGAFSHDDELAHLQKDARELAETGDRFADLRHDRFGALEAILHDGIVVRFGDEANLGSKQRLIGPILAQLGTRAVKVRSVDLRAPATPVVEYR